MAKIRDIYAGKPDAKDEVINSGHKTFLDSLVVPQGFDFSKITSGDKYFITGLKGTGKTALLFYLENLFLSIDPSTCTSIIFFNDQFPLVTRNTLSSISNRIASAIIVDNDVLLGGEDYEYIWKWLIFNQICSDNEDFNGGLFVHDENWDNFCKAINKIHAPLQNRSRTIPKKITIGVEINKTASIIKPAIEIDFQNLSKSNNFDIFISMVNEAEKAFQSVHRTDIPYYIFIDELEAYYGNEEIFKRDLRLLRDLIFVVKIFNNTFKSLNMKSTMIICSLRTEIINSIERFVVTKEVNKSIGGFSVPLNWNYTNTTSYEHPLIQMLLRRIMLAEGNLNQNTKDVYDRWFPDSIHETPASNYILNNSWNKPRDIVRLITTAKDSLQKDNTSFTQAVFDSIKKTYSQDSLIEVREELRALYNSEILDSIIQLFSGFYYMFSLDDLRDRIQLDFSDSYLDQNLIKILKDLYRVGFLGNYLPSEKKYRWNHKGDAELLLTSSWKMVIHRALQPALSTIAPNKTQKSISNEIKIGEVLPAKVYKIFKNRIVVDIMKSTKKVKGGFKCDHTSKYFENEKLKVKVISYDKRHCSWNVEPIE